MKRHVIFFFFLTLFLQSSAQNADIDLLRDINLKRNTKLDQGFKIISHSAMPVCVVLPLGLAGTGLINKDETTFRNGLESGASFLLASGITFGLKYTINRKRPYRTYPDIANLVSEGSPSFPSGHTSTAFATATSMSLMYPKWYVITPSFTWACLVGYSRMHLGVHYPSDVLMGILVGTGAAFLCHQGSRWLDKK